MTLLENGILLYLISESCDKVLLYLTLVLLVMIIEPLAASLVAPAIGVPTLVKVDKSVCDMIAWCMILESDISHICAMEGQPTAPRRTDVDAREYVCPRHILAAVSIIVWSLYCW